jgi:hypothetical protein
VNESNNNAPHAHPDEKEMLRMKMAADRTRLEAAGRLASYEASVERERMIGKLEVWGLAAVAGAVVFALLMREGPRRRMTDGLSRAAGHLYRLKRRDKLLPRVRQFIEGVGR